MARRLKGNFVALGSAAIVAVYAIGYAWTEHTAPSGGAPAPASQTATALARSIAAAPPSPSASGAGETAGVPTYRDGTYVGTGTSRRGEISVTLTVQNGKVAEVKISRATTYYPTSEIARLPAEVVSRQSANVDFVSGATESSLAFRGAVAQALSQARGPSTTAVPQVAAGA